ncbi:polyhomeotic-like protein 2 isoform X3 [Acanthaster planci]|uniref:Polyhomeotic-like protein 2 isoform X3 n=1 Tax=Acanthaster planci TaxID=133434 RepID=A0A8B8A2V9_ACAPL|nr:polyhomeotic-like protein 2 isoform X3 [Acanthaster planci]
MSNQQSSPRPQATTMATTSTTSATTPPSNPPLLVEQSKHPMTSPSPSPSSVPILPPAVPPPAVPPPAHQRLTVPSPSSSNASSGHSPTAGLGPPVLSPSLHQHPSLYPSGSSPVSATPVPMTVTSPIGKHGGSLGALTASVNALQRPTSTSGHYLVQHSPKSPPSTALVSGIPTGIRLLRPPLKSPSGARSDQAIISTTQTPIFNRSHHLPTTATLTSPSGTTTMVRVTPSMQQAIHHSQQRPLIIQPGMMSNLGLITTADGPLIRGVTPTCSIVNPTMINPYNVGQSKLHSALTGFGDGHPPRIHVPPSPHGPLSLVAQVQPQGKGTFTLHPQKTIATSNLPLHAQMRTIAPAKSPTSHVPLQPKRPPPYPSGPSNPLSQHPLSPGASDAVRHSNPKVKPPSSAPKPGPQVRPIKPVQQQAQTSGVKVVKPVQREKKSPPAPVPVPPLVIPTAPVRPDVTSTVQPQLPQPPATQPEIVNPQPRAEVVGVTEGVARVERQVPKAVVKPQVLTHIIDGFIIEESKEPFSIPPSSLWTDDYPQLDSRLQRSRNNQDERQEGSQAQKRPAPSEGRDDADRTPLRCEFCGKVDRPHKFKRSKRFCSLSCSKRYNVGCSKRLGLFAPQRENSERLKHKLKLQTKAKPLKGSRGKHGRLSFNVDRPWCHLLNAKSFHPFTQTERVYGQDPPPGTSGSASLPPGGNPSSATTASQDRDSNSSSLGPSEGSSSMESSLTLSPAPNSDAEDTTPPVSDDAFDDLAGLGGDPAKWSVQDVYDFIRDLPGCSDYADEFLRQEIDGQALMLLKEDHLMTAMNMKLGPALKIISRIYSLKEKL